MVLTSPKMGVPLTGIDEAWDKVAPADLVARGYHFVFGYVSQNTTGKNLTRQQILGYLAAGIDVALVYEYDPKAALGGGTQGRLDAQIAVSDALQLGAPPGTAIYFAVDFDVQESEIQRSLAYLVGASGVCHDHGLRSGVYGGKRIVDATVVNVPAVEFLWQTYAWSGGLWSARAGVRQTRNGLAVAGHTVDSDTATIVDFGQWRHDGATPPSGGPVTQPSEGQQIADTDWTVTHMPNPAGTGDPVPLHVWGKGVNDTLAALTTALQKLQILLGNLDATQTAIATAVTDMHSVLIHPDGTGGPGADVNSEALAAWQRIADAADLVGTYVRGLLPQPMAGQAPPTDTLP